MSVARTAARPDAPAEGAADAQEAMRALLGHAMIYHRRLARSRGFSVPQLMVLHCVRANGPVRPSAIAERLAISRPAASLELSNLRKAGWLRLDHPPGDRRSLLVHLTPKAEREIARAKGEADRYFRGAVGRLRPEERDELARLLLRLLEGLRAEDDDRAPGTARKA